MIENILELNVDVCGRWGSKRRGGVSGWYVCVVCVSGVCVSVGEGGPNGDHRRI